MGNVFKSSLKSSKSCVCNFEKHLMVERSFVTFAIILSLLSRASITGRPDTDVSNIKTRWEGVAVIVEPRRDTRLLSVMTQFQSVLPITWRFHLFHGTENIDIATLACDSMTAFSATTSEASCLLTNLDVKNLIPKDIAYNALLVSPKFWFV